MSDENNSMLQFGGYEIKKMRVYPGTKPEPPRSQTTQKATSATKKSPSYQMSSGTSERQEASSEQLTLFSRKEEAPFGERSSISQFSS